MKKLIFVFAGLLAFSVINAQSLEEIIKKYSEANKLDQLSNLKTIKITSKVSVMGNEIQLELWMKKPNKLKTVSEKDGNGTLTIYDGEKGYMVNYAGDSRNVIEMTPDMIKEMNRLNMFENCWIEYYNNGQLSLEGEELVNESPAFKLKAALNEGITNLFIDKGSYLLVKQSASSNMGETELFPSDYMETNRVFLPMKTKSTLMGMEVTTTVTKVEVDIPMEDSIFRLK
jgi:outer membrane lipoprotein-sorting protein